MGSAFSECSTKMFTVLSFFLCFGGAFTYASPFEVDLREHGMIDPDTVCDGMPENWPVIYGYAHLAKEMEPSGRIQELDDDDIEERRGTKKPKPSRKPKPSGKPSPKPSGKPESQNQARNQQDIEIICFLLNKLKM